MSGPGTTSRGGTPIPVTRGDVVLLDWPFAAGAGVKRRPGVVVQADALNARLSNTVVAAVTSNTRRSGHASQLLIEAATPDGRACGLLHDSALTAENLFTVARSKVLRKIGRLPDPLLVQFDDCLRAALDL